jgi:hypothetical protein
MSYVEWTYELGILEELIEILLLQTQSPTERDAIRHLKWARYYLRRARRESLDLR